MNATEFVFAVIAVSTMTAVIYAWYAWIYSLDDGYQASREKKRKTSRTRAQDAARTRVQPRAEEEESYERSPGQIAATHVK